MSQKILSGNAAVAEAMRQINPDVVAAYPITPTSYIVEHFSQFVADGRVATEFVPCESEHSAISACVGAAAAGCRAMTATASQGLALMHEVLFNASGLRLPIVLLNGNRALSAPLSIHGDHSDAMAQRDTGWIQLFARDPQEAYDLTLQAFRIAEDKRIRLPVMVCFDAFDTTHLVTNVEILSDAVVTKFLGETRTSNPLLDFDHPASYGTYTNPDYYFEFRRAQNEGLLNALTVIPKIGAEFSEISRRNFAGHFTDYELTDAELVIVVAGSAAGSVQAAVDKLRTAGKKVGLLRLRSFRPFPATALVKTLQKAKAVAVLDRTMPSGTLGSPIFVELTAALQAEGSTMRIHNFIYGIGQRDFGPRDAEAIFTGLSDPATPLLNFVNLRE